MLRKLTKQINDSRNARDNEGIKNNLKDYDDAMEKFMPILMGQCKIYWEKENYTFVEKIFRQSAEFCFEHETWRLNMAHVLFMKEKQKEAIKLQEPFVKKYWDEILNVHAIVLANICVALIMVTQNNEAEEIMKKVEQEEEKMADTEKNQ